MAAAVKGTFNNVLDKLHLSSAPSSAPPSEPSDEELKTLREKYEKSNQGQVFAFYDSLTSPERGVLYDQLASIDPEYVNQIANKALNPAKAEANNAVPSVEPLPDSATASVLDSKDEEIEGWYKSGLELVADGKVAVVLMAGGQGTRLGSSAPKGCFNIGLPSEKSLFQIQAERIYRVQQLAQKHHNKENVVVPWYIMTSGPTRAPTERFFVEHNYFGLKKENVLFFEQGVLPCISNDGKILLESKSKVFRPHLQRLNNRSLTNELGCGRARWQRRHLSSNSHISGPWGLAKPGN